MTSRRRLDISSLLCDNEDSSASRPDITTQLSRSPAQSPVHLQHQAHPTPVDFAKSPYPPNEQSILARTTQVHGGLQQEQAEWRYRHQQEQDAHLSRTYHNSPRSLPSDSALLPLAVQPLPTRRRTPSPPFSLPSASPVNRSGPVRRGRHSDGLREPDFPRPTSSTTQADLAQTHPHRYTQFPLPPSTTPVNINDALGASRASAKLSPHQYSPISLPHLSPSSPSLPTNFPSSARPVSLSPTDLSRSVRPSTAGSSERHFQRSPIMSRLPDSTMYSSQRVSASLSPTVPKSGLSGLDVLVQAATEERERIDVHRRLSGGEEPPPSLNFTSTVRPASLSLVESRRMEMLHAPPLTPPYTASSQSIGYSSASYADARYKGQGYVESTPELVRGRPSPESSRLHQAIVLQTTQYSPRTTQILSSGALRRRSRSPETTYVEYERESHKPMDSFSVGSRDILASRPESLYGIPSSARTSFQNPAFNFENEQTSAPGRHSHSLSPVEPAIHPHIRRSPPRSRPKPKKPGSAALAMMQQELQGVALTDRSQKEPIVDHGSISAKKHAGRTSSLQAHSDKKLPDINSRSRQSNERGAADDEEVDDFFLSTFDSPRNVERQIPSKKPSPIVIPAAHARESGYSAEQWNDAPSRHHDAVALARSPMKSASSPVNMGEMSGQLYGDRGTFVHDDEETMSDVEAEILDELVDAAGATTSEEERTEFDDQETDNVEMDVDDELLKLVDGPSEHSPKTHYHPKLPSYHLQKFPPTGRMSMAPPDALLAASAQAKDTKSSAAKHKTQAKADGTNKAPHTLREKSPIKAIKSKSGSKPRPAKGSQADKVKATQPSGEVSTPTSASFPMTSIPLSTSGTPTSEVFPIVTSSGRMVTKSKKVAAGAATSGGPSGQPVAHHGRKKTAAAGLKDSSGSRSGSRSQSVAPRASIDPESQREKDAKDAEEKAKEKEAAAEEPDEGEKDRLYCICRTQYDEDRVMIACDRCDEWYHTQCLEMPDLLIDLVDQFICSNCVAQNPSLNLGTTYKQRCFAGLKHPDPDSPDACHKPSRGAYSKYCSDECGVRYMHRKIQAWTTTGGDVHSLWESVKDAKRREGFVTREPGRTLPKAILAEIQNNSIPKPPGSASEAGQVVADEEGRSSIVMRLEEQLRTVAREREEIKQELQVLSWRERLLQLASERAENVGECGWDQRLVYGDEEWLDFGAGVLESYEETVPIGHSEENEENEEMDVDAQAVVGEWWCRGKKKCERHQGWQRVRAADLEKERDTKESALADLTTREREIRNRIEDILHPQSRPLGTLPEATFKFKLGSEAAAAKKSKKKATPVAA